MNSLADLTGGESGWTQDFEFIRGEYAIGGERVPYFSIVMTITDALKYLTLASELGVDPSDPIDIEELIQRDLDRERAASEIVNYLRQPSIKFFNAFTVVLMPVSQEGSPLPAFPPDEPEEAAVNEASSPFVASRAGPVMFRRLREGNAGYIKWETGSVRAVIIDGQHRFLALDRVHRDMPVHLRSDITSIPILLLILDSRAGFTAPTGGPSEIIRASRAIFTDINKHAVKVTPEREYLLDDRSLIAVAMRSILTSRIGGDSNVLSQQPPARIPLAVVDWNRPGQSKFSDSFYVSTVQALHQLTAEVLNIRQPDASDYDQLAGWLDKVTARLELTPADGWEFAALRERLTDSEDQSEPFILSIDEVANAAAAFGRTVGQVITSTILRATPYRELLDAYRESGLLGGREELWLGQNEDGRRTYEAQFNEDPRSTAEVAASHVKGRYRLAYQVVFQRGFVVAAREVDAHRSPLAEAWGLESNSHDTVLERWIQSFNAVIAGTLSDDALWTGTAIGLDGSIDYKQTSKNAIMGLTLLGTMRDITLEGEDEVDLSRNDIRRILTSKRGAQSPLVADPYRRDSVSDVAQQAVRRWAYLLGLLTPGRPSGPSGPSVRVLLRSAASVYRAGIRRYVDDLASVSGQELTAKARDDLVLVHGGRRLAELAMRSAVD